MFKKNSFFIKIFIPVIAVMLLQTSIIGLALTVTGSITSLEDASLATLSKNAESRGATLEQMMVYYWSNIDRLEMSVVELIDDYLKEQNIPLEQAIGNYTHETAMLTGISHSLLDALRTSASTGVFIMFLDIEGLQHERQTRNGLYYRDLDPLSNPADNSDIMFLKGFIDIARKDRIQLDSLWSEVFVFDPKDEDLWRGFSNPQTAAKQYPGISSENLAYWNGPHLQNPGSVLDSNKCITYTRPVFYDGNLIALIGTEVQVTALEKYFPANDFESTDRGGYVLVSYDKEQEEIRDSTVFHVTGSYIRRLVPSDNSITLIPSSKDGFYTLDSDNARDSVHIAERTLRLYNSNAPFSNQQWALLSLETDDMLFSTARQVQIGIIVGSLLAFVLGSIMLTLTIRRAANPLISIATQIEKADRADGGKLLFSSGSNIYELNLLCSTLNMMRERQSLADAQIREERQRYLVALESVADTFLEYDAKQDLFTLYYFSRDNKKLSSNSINAFSQAVFSGDFCHPDDVQNILGFLQDTNMQTIEIRARTSVFSHITDTEPDNGYFWFSIKTSNILDEDGNVYKIIGTAREITRKKLKQFARSEQARRDPTTKFYNREYGLQAVCGIQNSADSAVLQTLCVLTLEDFDKLESYYGRTFGGFVLLSFSKAVREHLSEKDIAVRLSNDSFLFCFHDCDANGNAAKTKQIEAIANSLYTGDNTAIALSPRMRCVSADDLSPERENADKPVNVFLDVSKDNIVSSVFELFERTSDIRSSIKILLGILGDIYELSRVIICSFDAEFGASQVTYQWMQPGHQPVHSGIEKVTHSVTAAFEELLDESGTLIYTGESAKTFGEGIAKLLCTAEMKEEMSALNALCCVMRDGEAQAGRVLFISENYYKTWSDEEKSDLCDIVKIISANISIDKSRLASRAKSEFLSRISHEIRTPMNAIIGMTDIAKTVTNDPERLLDSLNQIDFSAKHLLSLINDVLEMSRIESGRLVIENVPFNIDELVSGIDILMRFPIMSKGITFNIEKQYKNNFVIGDVHRLRQVLVNLLGNANKFTDKGGTITFSVRQRNSTDDVISPPEHNDINYGIFEFSVIDTGAGISPEDQQLIFEAFGQSSAMTSVQQQGTGLGLAISDSIITAMGGKIELDSTPGEGSDFHFTIMLELRDEEEAGVEEAGETINYTGRFADKRALLVDDISSNIAVAAFALNDTGIDIDVASNGQEAIEMFFDSPLFYYDIIFMDVKMPVMDGFTATRKIRGCTEREDAQIVPIVAMTANAYDEDMKKTIESGMNGHISKPIVKETLYELMSRLLK